MRTVLITGGSGFCGRHLALRLRQEGPMRLVGIARHRPTAAASGLWDDFFAQDITERKALDEVVRHVQPDWVFHLAGNPAGSVAEMQATIIGGTSNLLEAVRAHAPAAGVLLVGSAAEYGHVDARELPITEGQVCQPSGPYGVAKYTATVAGLEYFQRQGMQVAVARPFNIIGAGVPRSLVVGALIDRIQRVAAGDEAVLRVGNLDTERDFVAVEDAVDAYVKILQGAFWGEIFNVCSGKPSAIRRIVDDLVHLAGRPIPIQVDSALVRPADVLVNYGSCAKATRRFGFAPATSLAQALKSAWDAAKGTATFGASANPT